MTKVVSFADGAAPPRYGAWFRRRVTVVLTLLAGMVIAPAIAEAQLNVDVTRGSQQPLPIAVTPFVGQEADMPLTEVIINDLSGSGLFAPIDPATFIQTDIDPDGEPRFGDWRIINAQALLVGRVTRLGDDRINVEFRLWDVFGGQQLTGQQFTTTPQNWRRIAHIIADAIYQRLTGEPGYFDSQIVFVAESGPRDNRIKQLAIMDQDGANLRYLSGGAPGDLVLTPRFSPSGQEITYMAFTADGPRVYLLNLVTGRTELVGSWPGMTFAPRFSADGQKVIMSLQSNGDSSIWTLDLRTGEQTRLTNAAAIDTSPSYSPDGTQIVFTSDRQGSPQLYVMNADGSNQHRISGFGTGSYSTPVWSPRGDLIAFTKQVDGQFAIGVMQPDGSGERILTQTGQVQEGPTWAPNGRVILFSREIPGASGGAQLWMIDLNGGNERRVPTEGFASDPAWSPLLN